MVRRDTAAILSMSSSGGRGNSKKERTRWYCAIDEVHIFRLPPVMDIMGYRVVSDGKCMLFVEVGRVKMRAEHYKVPMQLLLKLVRQAMMGALVWIEKHEVIGGNAVLVVIL